MRGEIESALGVDLFAEVTGDERLPSCFEVSELLSASVAAVASAASSLVEAVGLASSPPPVCVHQRLVSLWAGRSIHPVGWEMPPVWDAVAGDYRTRDGWIKLHTNLAHHRRAALSVLGVEPDRGLVARAVADWDAEALETAIVDANGVAAAMRSRDEWLRHPQGVAVATEPLIAWDAGRPGSLRSWGGTRDRPLAGLRVLDLTRVIAGPVATRTLAGLGATVLRIDPPDWEEANVVPDVTLGKRCAHLQLDTSEGKASLERLLADADVLVHGYRPGALDGLGLGAEARQRLNPHLIEATLDAYGWTGPWAGRRGFDSLVQMSCGIAEAGMTWSSRTEPTPLPVQALDHATGYLMAAATLAALCKGARGNGIGSARLSLARTGYLLARHPATITGTLGLRPEQADLSPITERTPWGDGRRLRPPFDMQGTTIAWDSPATELGATSATWSD
ncbi:CoA transferase [Sphingomonas dokdonensis]|uniref:Formyl-coenzyme A transferase n=1 Tax=Sphingomonas dokdonensis TaxID=344880 RepID=A0A245ZCX2_9SPHN|nr:CoA transferase [Sphingomonas dokdonensis]OWK27539.1 formyl-coenzyme A transferase [Sphingomonas dokdonensis]